MRSNYAELLYVVWRSGKLRPYIQSRFRSHGLQVMAAKALLVAVPHHLIFLLAGQIEEEDAIRVSVALRRAVQFLGVIGGVGIVDQYELQHPRVARSLQLRYLQLHTRSFTVGGRDRGRCCGWCRWG